MLPKTPTTMSRLSTSRRDDNISMVDNNITQDSQMVTMRELRGVVDQINNNQQALDNKVNEMGLSRIKLPFIERFDGTKLKLKGFFL